MNYTKIKALIAKDDSYEYRFSTGKAVRAGWETVKDDKGAAVTRGQSTLMKKAKFKAEEKATPEPKPKTKTEPKSK